MILGSHTISTHSTLQLRSLLKDIAHEPHARMRTDQRNPSRTHRCETTRDTTPTTHSDTHSRLRCRLRVRVVTLHRVAPALTIAQPDSKPGGIAFAMQHATPAASARNDGTRHHRWASLARRMIRFFAWRSEAAMHRQYAQPQHMRNKSTTASTMRNACA